MKSRKLGFRYSISKEQIRAYRKLSVKEKLAWLEEANRISHKFIKGKRRQIWQSLRRGTV